MHGRRSANPKARAAGYSHTYFDNEGLNFATLSLFPSDSEIDSISEIAAQEADSLVSLLGVSPGQLHRSQGVGNIPWLPSIKSWFGSDMKGCGLNNSDYGSQESDKEDEETDNQELQRILDAEEESAFSCLHATDVKCLSLTSAALALVVEESATV